MIELKRIENENEEQFIWRIGQAKDNGALDMSWEEIGELINGEFRDDETEYRTESAYRKQYQNAKRYFDSGVFSEISDDENYAAELIEAKHELRKEKQKLSDERVALNKILRENARVEENLLKLENIIKEQSSFLTPYSRKELPSCSDNDMIICLSDFHIGLTQDNNFGAFNSEIAAERLDKYFQEILKIKELHKSESAYVLLLGDQINGRIHLTTQLENRENVIGQIQIAAELISSFTMSLSEYFNNVYVNHVSGNHSRLSMKKDTVVRSERLDELVPWYMNARLSHCNNVIFIDDDNYDKTIGCFENRGNTYLLVHGDYDKFDQSGVSKLVLMTKVNPTAIFYGHKHTCSTDDVANIKIIRSGSFAGTCDDYTISKRIYGEPSQMVCIADKSGIYAYYPIKL